MEAAWYVLWTQSHCEHIVHDKLIKRGFNLFLPTMAVWVRRRGIRQRASVPMFPGYLFLHRAMDKASFLEIRKTEGLVKILGEGWDRLAMIPEKEIEAIQKVHDARLPTRPHDYLREGERVRITKGLMAGVEGILLRSKPSKGLLVVSIEILQRAVAVEIDCTLVVPA